MKRFFLARTTRERALLLVFVFAAAVVWLASAAERLSNQMRAHRQAVVDADAQKLWLDSKAEIDGRAARAAASLVPASTLDATRLVGEVSAIAARAGLSPVVESPRTQHADQFSYHTVQVGFRRANLPALIKFYRELVQRAPYLALEECALSATRANPAELDAQFTIFSVEIAKTER
jgi:hypothetical protein